MQQNLETFKILGSPRLKAITSCPLAFNSLLIRAIARVASKAHSYLAQIRIRFFNIATNNCISNFC